MKKPLHGILISSILHYKQFRSNIEKIGYKTNPCGMCIASKKTNGSQHTLAWHADDVKASHEDARVNDGFYEWLNEKHGSEEIYLCSYRDFPL